MKEIIETIVDSIAIEILNEYNIIRGKGNQLFLYSQLPENVNSNAAQEIRVNAKLNNKIHGICKGNKNILLVYGEKEFMLLKYECHPQDEREIKSFHTEFYRASLSDWISCGVFLKDEFNQFVLCTAHSVVLRFTYNESNGGYCDLIERISCEDKSTLYCSYLFGKTWEDIVVFSGNAFGELIIWQPNLKGDEKLEKCVPLIHRISAHNGVIFSIDYNEKSQQLITTSDDRAVKWWKVKFLANGQKRRWHGSTLHPVASGYGHVARVFRGKIIENDNHTYALSVGEDSFWCLWRNNGELVYKRRQQYGAVIWNFAYDSKIKTIYTIGSIGNIIAYGLRNILFNAENESNDSVRLLPDVSSINPKEYIAKIKFLSLHTGIIVGITNENHIKWLKMSDNMTNDSNKDFSLLQWNDSEIPIDFKCTVMEVWSNRIALCGYKRILLIDWNSKTEKFEIVIDKNLLQGIIRTFIFFSLDKYLLCDDKGNCLILNQKLNEFEKTVQLPLCKEPWLTTALLIREDTILIASNRLGNLLFFNRSENGMIYELRQTIKHPHGNLGATSLQLLNGHKGQEEKEEVFVRSSGHDGAVNLFHVNFKDFHIKFSSRQIIPVSWVEHIEANVFENVNLFLGFNDNHFVVWSKEYDFHMQLSCGGGHRCWDYNLDQRSNKISLVFIKNKRVRFFNLPLFNQEQLRMVPPKLWHIASCNKMVIFNDSVAISAGDDNLIKIHKITKNGLEQKQELHCHISNVRALKTIGMEDNSFLIFSGGGRAQLCITNVRLKDFYTEELINYTLGRKLEADTTTNNNKKSDYKIDPETRIMSLDVRRIKENIYHIITGCSDGFLRLLSFDMDKCEISQIYDYLYNRCLLQVEFIKQGQYILTAATDGIIRIFDSQLQKCRQQFNHHSNGVNSLSTYQKREKNALKILTGGDDQAVAFTELDLETWNVTKSFRKPFLHTAQVCAAAITSDGRFGYTSGVDQNVYKFDLCKDSSDDKNDEIVIDSFHSCIADIKGIALFAQNKYLIYGCGMQFIKDSHIT